LSGGPVLAIPNPVHDLDAHVIRLSVLRVPVAEARQVATEGRAERRRGRVSEVGLHGKAAGVRAVADVAVHVRLREVRADRHSLRLRQEGSHECHRKRDADCHC